MNEKKRRLVTVIGAGRASSEPLNRMISNKMQYVDFVQATSDSEAVSSDSLAPMHLYYHPDDIEHANNLLQEKLVHIDMVVIISNDRDIDSIRISIWIAKIANPSSSP